MSPLEALASQSGHATGASRPIITVTDAALAKIIELRNEEADADQLGLRLAIASGPGEDFRYDLSFDEFLKADFTDEVRTHTGGDGLTIKVIIPAGDVDRLQDATLDYGDTQGLVIRNPNRPAAPSVEGLVQGDELSAEIEAMVTNEVNPALAAHGGQSRGRTCPDAGAIPTDRCHQPVPVWGRRPRCLPVQRALTFALHRPPVRTAARSIRPAGRGRPSGHRRPVRRRIG